MSLYISTHQLRKLVEDGKSPLEHLFDQNSIGAAAIAMHVIFHLSKKPNYAKSQYIARHDCVRRIRQLSPYKVADTGQMAEEMLDTLMHEGIIYAQTIRPSTKPLKVIWPRLDHAAWELFRS